MARSVAHFTFIVVVVSTWSDAHAADDRGWSIASYGVHIHIAIDSSANPGFVREDLIKQVEGQVRRNLYPYWKSKLTLQAGGQRSVLLRQLDRLDRSQTEFEIGTDKTIFLTVVASGTGARLSCRERDTLTKRWTPVISRDGLQDVLLPQTCFELLSETFCPRALVEVDPQNERQTKLVVRGSALLSEDNRALLLSPDSIFQPYLVRSDRAGSSAGRVIEVPWTYLVVDKTEGDSWSASVYSGARRPFGARRRAGVDIVALGLKAGSQGTRIRFHAGHDPSQSLVGYQVFEKSADADEFQPSGFTDKNGSVSVRRGNFPITLLALRAEGQPLAQVPIAPGTVSTLEIPVADDLARLRVQDSLTTFREQMIDVVARRNILMARARDQLQKGKQQQAKDLLNQIGNLPTRANMDRYLATLERDPASQSENPRVQAKIDRLFADSRKMMSTYLTTRELLELETEVNRFRGETGE